MPAIAQRKGYIRYLDNPATEFPVILDCVYRARSMSQAANLLSAQWGFLVGNQEITDIFSVLRRAGSDLKPVSQYLGARNRVDMKKLVFPIQPGPRPNFETEDSKEQKIISELIKYLRRNRTATITDLADLINVSPSNIKRLLSVAEGSGHEIGQMKDGTLYLHSPSMFQTATWGHARTIEILPVSGKVSFAILSDPHFGSKVAMIDEISDFVDYAYNVRKIKTILVPGDLCDSYVVYKNQLDEIECWKMEDQLDLLIKNLPQYPGLKYYYILGNHDLADNKSGAISISRVLEQERKDMVCLGSYRARVKIPDKNGVDIEMRHSGKGGSVYSMSYPIQQIVERGMTGGSKPHIFIAGHLHTAMYIPLLRNVHTFSAGCFQGETTLTIRLNIPVMVGGWICDIEYDTNKWIKQMNANFRSYYLGLRGTYTGKKKTGIHRMKPVEGWAEE